MPKISGPPWVQNPRIASDDNRCRTPPAADALQAKQKQAAACVPATCLVTCVCRQADSHVDKTKATCTALGQKASS